MGAIPLHLQRIFEQRWAAKLASLGCIGGAEKHRVEQPPTACDA
jgi:hypothetical protein